MEVDFEVQLTSNEAREQENKRTKNEGVLAQNEIVDE